MSVRPARIDDAAAIASLSGELGYPATPEQMAGRLREALARTDGVVLVAEDAGTVVGWTHLIGCYRLEEDAFGEIAGFVVAETHRGRGVGAQLLTVAEDWARERGYHRVVVRSNVIRERAHKFYEREGYVQFKRQAVFAKRLH